MAYLGLPLFPLHTLLPLLLLLAAFCPHIISEPTKDVPIAQQLTSVVCDFVIAPLPINKTASLGNPTDAYLYCKRHDDPLNYVCLEASCDTDHLPTIKGCQLITSSPEDPNLTTDGHLIADPVSCYGYLFVQPSTVTNPNDPSQGSICMNNNNAYICQTTTQSPGLSCGKCLGVKFNGKSGS